MRDLNEDWNSSFESDVSFRRLSEGIDDEIDERPQLRCRPSVGVVDDVHRQQRQLTVFQKTDKAPHSNIVCNKHLRLHDDSYARDGGHSECLSIVDRQSSGHRYVVCLIQFAQLPTILLPPISKPEAVVLTQVLGHFGGSGLVEIRGGSAQPHGVGLQRFGHEF
jgi:hypothetical protein